MINHINFEQERLLKAEEVAVYLNVSRSFVYKLMNQGQLRYVQINNSKRVRSEDLMEFIKSSLTSVPSANYKS